MQRIAVPTAIKRALKRVPERSPSENYSLICGKLNTTKFSHSYHIDHTAKSMETRR